MSAIQLPKDQYAHVGAPSEWWWHIGTISTADGSRTFGFEINATGITGIASFSQISITDVQNQIHYQSSAVFPWDANWAESDSTKAWFVNVGKAPSNGSVSMTGNDFGQKNEMSIVGEFLDAETQTPCSINLSLHQTGPPLLVFGTGVHTDVNPQGKTPLTKNNYYYSFTRLSAVGSISMGSEKVSVVGTTWMDHEYGAFPNNFTWALQDATLDNGTQLSSFAPPDADIKLGLAFSSFVSIIWPDGNSTFEQSVTTPLGPVWASSFPAKGKGNSYFTQYKVEVPKYNTVLLFTASMPDQEFRQQGTENPPVWEGVAIVEGTFRGEMVCGTAWIEQNFGGGATGALRGGRAGFVDLKL
ncbi:uncharacterized protein LY89DRAFT_126829 [Mollisia scopiformis]|uniref:AttH domain-containing protein n=1 Tax=Mollisia scopiformis TaxID=149040 RepID=A0A194X465_MOLSC|nr:uncharacterized protein LY89DRAFT_126829 [Mollisia scopiformis]KUJ14975.1 hypothetical protein LY89DRAFT_126829 [Mollisia scopiformis]